MMKSRSDVTHADANRSDRSFVLKEKGWRAAAGAGVDRPWP
jgi:hypothetical protein